MARTVLLADDSVTAQNMGRRILTDAGYEVITVNNGSAALKKVHESRPDLIVLDVYMPGYGGLEVCQRLKESGETMRIPVLLTVGKMEPFKSDEAKRVRADGHIVKPFEASELLAALTKLEDKIVPGVDGRGRKGKADKKPRAWHAGDDPAQAPTEWSDRVAYLADAKQRSVNNEPEVAPEPEVATPRRPKAVEPSEPAPEMAVVADPVTEESARVPDVRAEQTESSDAADESPQVQSQGKVEKTLSDARGSGKREEAQALESKPATSPQEEPVAAVSVPAAVPGRPRWVAQSVELSPQEAALELDREMQESQRQSTTSDSIPATPELTSAEPPAKSPSSESEERNGAAFAAAASASAVSNAVASAPQAPAASEEEPAPAGLDAAAAWKNWQQIRDSVMSAQNAGAIETAVSAITNAAAAQEATAAAPATETAGADSSQPLQGEALASIVDTVLAELKPKLMEQIAKKLAAEKK